MHVVREEGEKKKSNINSHHLHHTTLKCEHQYPQIVNMCINFIH